MVMIISLFLLAGVDLLGKWYIETYVGDKEIRSYLKDRLKVRKLHNPGFLLEKGKEHQDIVRKSSLAVMIVVGLEWLFLLPSKGHKALKACTTLLFAGAISNVSDRFYRRYVVDYLSVRTKWERLNRLVFNLADLWILLGSVGLLVTSFFTSGKKLKNK